MVSLGVPDLWDRHSVVLEIPLQAGELAIIENPCLVGDGHSVALGPVDRSSFATTNPYGNPTFCFARGRVELDVAGVLGKVPPSLSFACRILKPGEPFPADLVDSSIRLLASHSSLSEAVERFNISAALETRSGTTTPLRGSTDFSRIRRALSSLVRSSHYGPKRRITLDDREMADDVCDLLKPTRVFADQDGPELLLIVLDEDGSSSPPVISSLLAQEYRHWTAEVVTTSVSQVHADDPRVRVRPYQLSATALVNDLLRSSSATYVTVIDFGAELYPEALSEIVAAAATRPKGIYGDYESDLGHDSSLMLLPDPNPELLAGSDYLGRLVFLATKALADSGGFLDLSQAGRWETHLRILCGEGIIDAVHVPRVLARMPSLPPEPEGDLRPVLAQVDKFLGGKARLAGADRVDLGTHGMGLELRLRPARKPKVSVIVPTRDSFETLRQLINGLDSTAYDPFEVVIVANRTTNAQSLALFDTLNRDRYRVVVDSEGFNFSRLVNLAGKNAQGEYICLLNDDIAIPDPAWLDEMVAWGELKGIGVVGAKLLYPDGTLQHAGAAFDEEIAQHIGVGRDRLDPGYLGRHQLAQRLSLVTGAAMLVRRSIFAELGGFDERYAVAYNDIDFCLRAAKAGYATVYAPTVRLIHFESKSRGSENVPSRRSQAAEESALLRLVHGYALSRDPHFGPLVVPDHGDTALRSNAARSAAGWRRVRIGPYDFQQERMWTVLEQGQELVIEFVAPLDLAPSRLEVIEFRASLDPGGHAGKLIVAKITKGVGDPVEAAVSVSEDGWITVQLDQPIAIGPAEHFEICLTGGEGVLLVPALAAGADTQASIVGGWLGHSPQLRIWISP